jgi:hypothetical protein
MAIMLHQEASSYFNILRVRVSTFRSSVYLPTQIRHGHILESAICCRRSSLQCDLAAAVPRPILLSSSPVATLLFMMRVPQV